MITTALTETDKESQEMSTSQLSSSRLQSSQSSVSSDGDLSFSLSIERELDALIIGDELPAFEIRLVSPLGRTPSPIDANPEDLQTPTRIPLCDDDSTPNACFCSDFVTLQEINAKISPPADEEYSKTALSRCNSLETIFEGVFLNTPPRKMNNARNLNSMRGNLFEKMVANRLKSGKENQVPNGSECSLLSPPNKIRTSHQCNLSNEDLCQSNLN